jgi:hypothetical protein
VELYFKRDETYVDPDDDDDEGEPVIKPPVVQMLGVFKKEKG